MNVLVVGSGGREHAFVKALSTSADLDRLLAAPGNPGMAALAECFDVAADDVPGQVALAKEHGVGLVVVGPEGPLVAGLVDALQNAGIPALGPNKAAAHLEGSKSFMKDMCRRARIPTAFSKAFNEVAEALAYVGSHDRWPSVIKADGLAAGKGVLIVHGCKEASVAIRDIMLNSRFGKAGHRILIEDFLEGEEISVIALVDGETISVLEASCDHKRAFDGDRGPNTGGMGAYSPSRLLTPRVYGQIEERILVPTVHAMSREGRPFQGILYVGLMLTIEGPFVLEYNVRGGDPEMQVLLPRLESDALGLFYATATGGLEEFGEVEWSPLTACGVVLADGGYPETTTPGELIRGIKNAEAMDNVFVYQAGTKAFGPHVKTAGGRVLCVTGLGHGLEGAREVAYKAVEKIQFEGMRYRTDIGWRELAPRPTAADPGEPTISEPSSTEPRTSEPRTTEPRTTEPRTTEPRTTGGE
ncbi:MAG: phosphoribosylamine--glycine ligase [Pseudohongiellaceae bacterium]|jgi:phosphoribosylamine--glycine ligase